MAQVYRGEKSMRYDNEYGPTIYFTDNVFVEFRNDWLQLTGDWNWYDISIALIQFHIEKDNVFSGWDIDVRLIGFGLRLRWNTEPNENTKEILNRVEELEKSLEEKKL